MVPQRSVHTKRHYSLLFRKDTTSFSLWCQGSIILVLLWVSYWSMILFFGAEFTVAFAKKYSGIIAPTAMAKVEIPTETEKTM
jgi:uncharacterized BrkB/YihY/UPF0761 family membrane protein